MNWFDAFKEVAIGISALSAAAVAWKGLFTWREQMVGKYQHEAAKAMLAALITLRNEVAKVRRQIAFLLESENTFDDPMEAEAWNNLIVDFFETSDEHRRSIAEKYDAFELAMVEAEVIWGNQIRAQVGPLRQMIDDLAKDMVLGKYHYAKGTALPPTVFGRLKNSTTLKRVESDGSVDVYWNEFQSLVDNIHAFLSVHLKGKN